LGDGSEKPDWGDKFEPIFFGGYIDDHGRIIDVWGLIFWLAGQVPVEPWAFTLRELFMINEAADFAKWNHTAAIEATIANSQRDEKKRRRPFTARNFHPHILFDIAKRKKLKEDKPVSITILRDVFVDGATFDEILDTHGV
jgi:hypothetical protein